MVVPIFINFKTCDTVHYYFCVYKLSAVCAFPSQDIVLKATMAVDNFHHTPLIHGIQNAEMH